MAENPLTCENPFGDCLTLYKSLTVCTHVIAKASGAYETNMGPGSVVADNFQVVCPPGAPAISVKCPGNFPIRKYTGTGTIGGAGTVTLSGVSDAVAVSSVGFFDESNLEQPCNEQSSSCVGILADEGRELFCSEPPVWSGALDCAQVGDPATDPPTGQPSPSPGEPSPKCSTNFLLLILQLFFGWLFSFCRF